MLKSSSTNGDRKSLGTRVLALLSIERYKVFPHPFKTPKNGHNFLYSKYSNLNQPTRLFSLVIAESIAIEFLCLDTLVEFGAGPGILRREESNEDKPAIRPSSSPASQEANVVEGIILYLGDMALDQETKPNSNNKI